MNATPLEAWHGCQAGCKMELRMMSQIAKKVAVVCVLMVIASMIVIPPTSNVAAGLIAPDSWRSYLTPGASSRSQVSINKNVITVDVPEGLLPSPFSGSSGAALASGGRKVRMLVSAYCPCARCCGFGACGITASGRSIRANGGRFVAADRLYPFDTRVSIPGYSQGQPVPVIDRGGKIKGAHLDVFFSTHAQAQQWGMRWMEVTVYSPSRGR